MKTSEIYRVVKLCLANIASDPTLSSSSNATSTCNSDTAELKHSDLSTQTVCRLWAGKGHIYKVSIKPTKTLPTTTNVIVKHITASSNNEVSLGDQRKAFSYQVEANFYEKLANELIDRHHLAIPRPYYVERNDGDEIIIGMSYIDSPNSSYMSDKNIKQVLSWLATLHASYWGDDRSKEIVAKVGLQPIGSYWHLETRPDEHKNMPNTGWEGRLKLAARAIHTRLHERDPMQCIIHGDAKDANILVVPDGIAMCDFQYCGKGPPTIDLAYYFCCSVGRDCNDSTLVEYYLERLKERLPEGAFVPTLQQFNDSLDLAYCDFYRFMSGWGFWGSGGEDRIHAVLDRLDGGSKLNSEQEYDEAVRREYG